MQRMKAPEWRPQPAAAIYDTLARSDDEKAALVRQGARLIAHDLIEVGVNVDCMPVLDVPVAGAHEVIGARAYASDPVQVARLGRAACEGLLAGGRAAGHQAHPRPRPRERRQPSGPAGRARDAR